MTWFCPFCFVVPPDGPEQWEGRPSMVVCSHCKCASPATSRRSPERDAARRLARLERVMGTHGSLCCVCHTAVDLAATGDAAPTICHVILRVDGGTNARRNQRIAHQACNLRRVRGPLPLGLPPPIMPPD